MQPRSIRALTCVTVALIRTGAPPWLLGTLLLGAVPARAAAADCAAIALHRVVSPRTSAASTRLHDGRNVPYVFEVSPAATITPDMVETATIEPLFALEAAHSQRARNSDLQPTFWELAVTLRPEAWASLRQALGNAADQVVSVCGDRVLGQFIAPAPDDDEMQIGLFQAAEEAKQVARILTDAHSERGLPIISNRGVSPVEIGDSLLDAVRSLRRCELGLAYATSPDDATVLVLAHCGVAAQMILRLTAAATIGEIEVNGGRAQTAEGVQTGMTVADATKQYGEPTVTAGSTRIYLTFASHPGIAFALSDEEARRYRAAKRKEVNRFARLESIVVFGAGGTISRFP